MIIFLIGFMGSGKSYVARQLTELIDFPSVDMDKAIEAQEGKSVKEIFAQNGESYFRKLEHQFIEAIDPKDDLIVATGGGAPCFYDNMRLMNEKGLTIYLNRSKEKCLEQLLKGIEKRPLLQGMSKDQVSDFYDNKLAERQSYYQQAKWQIGDLEAEELANKIIMYQTGY